MQICTGFGALALAIASTGDAVNSRLERRGAVAQAHRSDGAEFAASIGARPTQNPKCRKPAGKGGLANIQESGDAGTRRDHTLNGR